MPLTSRRPRPRGPEPLAAKVPEITALFWVIKILTTGMGESISDFLGQVSVPMAGLVGVTVVTVALRLQLRAREYRAPIYWFAVMAVAVFGTMVADGIKDGAGIPYSVASLLYATGAVVVFVRWHRSEGTLSIHSISTRRRELFYWSAVLATFALGTAAGDLTALSMNLGFLGSVAFFGAVILVPGIAWWLGRLNPIAAFWAAYIVTRPLGASVVDWFSKPRRITGLDVGDGPVSAVALVLFVALVAWVAVRRRDIQDPDVPHDVPHPHPHPHPHLPQLGRPPVPHPAHG